MSYVYLFHFERPISPGHTTQHYAGFCECLAARNQAHERGRGARLTQIARQRGISWDVVRVWKSSREFERWLKRQKNLRRFCPVCSQVEKQLLGELSTDQIRDALIPF